MPFIEKTIISGDVLEIRRYFSSRYGIHEPRSPKEKPTAEAVEKINERNARNNLIRLVDTNFWPGDYYLTLTYPSKDEMGKWLPPPTPEEAKDYLAKYMRRLRSLYKRMGLELRYIAITEYRGENGAGVRPHHHLILNKSDIKEVMALWFTARITFSILNKDHEYKWLTKYITKESISLAPKEERFFGKRWNASKNLKKPTVATREIKGVDTARPPKEVAGVNRGLKKYKGYKIFDWYNGYSDLNGPYQYVKMIKVLPDPAIPKPAAAKTHPSTKGGRKKAKPMKRRC